MSSFFAKVISEAIASRLWLVVAKEAVENDEVVDLRNAADEVVVLPEETLELAAWPVDRELRWMKR